MQDLKEKATIKNSIMKFDEVEINDLLYKDLKSRIDKIRKKKNRYIVLHRATKVIVFLAGASITILTGWKMTEGRKFDPDNYILVISACIAVFAAVDGLFNFKDKGRSYDFFLFELRRLRDKICFEYTKRPDLYNEKKDAHFIEYQEILQSQKSIIENSDSGD
jgi:hypothetical protein